MSTKQRPTLLEYFLRLLLNQVITTVSPNGYQLKGTLVKFDPNSIILSTCQYTNAPKEALVENYLAIIPHVLAPTDTPHYPIMFPGTTSVRQEFLQDLLGKEIDYWGFNGHKIRGILRAYDEYHVIIETDYYGDSWKHILLTTAATIIPTI